ncbi:MAG: ATP-binding cassette domain-containing protein [Lachnospiraceae bacterium]|nr:ATP-binding cassette domain-containing protein [Lachnospiraceae bacterium]
MEVRKDYAVQMHDITIKFGSYTALDGVQLDVKKGSIHAVLGENGAGKTTLMRIVAGIMKPDTGKILYNGVPIEVLKESYRDIFGYLPQEFGFYPEFNVTDYLEYVAALKGLTKKDTKEKLEELLDKMTLYEVRNKKISKLSGGMKRRVGIAQALLNEPEVLILDEPTSGLDPGERVRFRNLLSEFAQERIVLISTHIVSDIEYIAMKNAIMKDGKLLSVGTTEELIHFVEGKVWGCVIPLERLADYERKYKIVNLKNEDSKNVSIRYLSDEPLIGGSQPEKARLEDLYLWLFPEALQESGKKTEM